jgi:hypothetical protein
VKRFFEIKTIAAQIPAAIESYQGTAGDSIIIMKQERNEESCVRRVIPLLGLSKTALKN